jgi:hypothetical protein
LGPLNSSLLLIIHRAVRIIEESYSVRFKISGNPKVMNSKIWEVAKTGGPGDWVENGSMGTLSLDPNFLFFFRRKS